MRLRSTPALFALASCIRGETSAILDWDPVIALANRTWLTPQLFVSLRQSGAFAGLPADVAGYLEFIHGRNLLRNTRLRRQLHEAVQELNANDIAPTLLKGAVPLVDAGDLQLGARMTVDLDLLVCTEEIEAAKATLVEIGYQEVAGADGASNVFARPDEAATIELHRWPGPTPMYDSLAGIAASTSRPAFGRSRVRVPPSYLRVLHLVLHDQIKEGDHWRRCVDLRHLHDIAEMAAKGIDWQALRATARRGLERDALECTLMAAERIFGIEAPPCPDRTLAQAYRHWWRMAQLAHPVAAAPLRILADIAWVNQRIVRREMYEWPGWRAAPRTLCKIVRTPALAYRALMGVHLGPKV